LKQYRVIIDFLRVFICNTRKEKEIFERIMIISDLGRELEIKKRR